MNILALEMSGKYLGVAITGEEGLRVETTIDPSMNHLKILLRVTEKVLEEACMELKDIDGYALSIGPGSFTGLRIAAATVKGLCVVDPKPVAAVPTLDALAWNHGASGERICSVIDAKRQQVYACFYRRGQSGIVRASRPAIMTPQEVLKSIRAKTVLAGDGSVYFKKNRHIIFSPSELNFPRASVVAAIGRKMIMAGKGMAVDKLEPIYLYKKKCIVQKKQ